MTSRLRRTLFALTFLALVATACSSGSDSDVETAGDTSDQAADSAAEATPSSLDTDDADADDPDDADTEDPEPVATATSIPVPTDDAAADAAIAGLDGDPDPAASVQGFVRNGFNIDPEPDQIQCIIDQADQDENLALALLKPAVATGAFDDTDLRALATAMNGCIATISLADWATQAIGPQGDVRDTAPPCFAERFDADDGDLIFYNFVALSYQNRLEPTGIDGLIDSLAACTPITSLSDFFASQAEQSVNFAVVIDRDCLNDALVPPEISLEFWGNFVDGGSPPVSFISPYTDACAEDPAAGFEPEVPTDFEPWAGTGALSGVLPAARNGLYSAPPPLTIDSSANYQAVIATGDGEIRIDLFADTAPLTVNNFVSLARDGYYDSTVFHRVLGGFMAQGGDPTGSGTGGPGYQFADEFEGGTPLDRKGLIAMANSGPNTNGSQFFITFVPTEGLTGVHTVFGEVTQGIEILDAIQLRDPAAPNGRGQLIESITIIES